MPDSSPKPHTHLPPREATNAQKSRRGFLRMWHATRYSMDGLRAGWQEAAFRSESMAAVLMVPIAFWLGEDWTQVSILAGAVVLVLIVELLNTGIESAIDRIGPEWDPLSKQAKDMGSAAVLLSLLMCGGIWLAALYHRFI